ncbi:DUF1413 domain-containing protein [Staphylococcus hominis]|uniref:DUF1413 domain-containing protein n=1 Tax=Staphylococcus hominis TaxID=1290 RepID=UPI00320497E9
MITINQVISEALKKKTGDRFEIKELFNSDDWEKETPQHRKDLGKEFVNYVENSKDFNLIYRKSDNHKVYERL